MANLNKQECVEIAEILTRRSNEIAMFLTDYRKDNNHLRSVELALSREIDRLRSLSEKVEDSIGDV